MADQDVQDTPLSAAISSEDPENQGTVFDTLGSLTDLHSKVLDNQGKMADNAAKQAQTQGIWQNLRSKKTLGDALGTFLFSLGQGIQASQQAPGNRGTMMGLGAAISGGGGYREQQQQQQLNQARIQDMQQQAALRKQQATPVPVIGIDGKPMLQDDGTPLMLPPAQSVGFSRELIKQSGMDKRTAVKNATATITNQLKASGQEVKLVPNDDGTVSVQPLAYEELTPQQRARRDATNAASDLRNAQARYKTIGGTLWDVSDPNNPKQVGDTRQSIEITPEIAQKYGLPDAILGQTLPVSAISTLAQANTKPYHFYATGDGTYVRNLITGTSEKLGPPPAQQGLAQKVFERDTYGTVGGVPVPGGPTDEQGRPIGFKTESLTGPTSTTRTKGDQAKAVQIEGNKLIAEIQANPQLVGLLKGQWSKFQRGIGLDDPAMSDISQLYTHLKSYAALQPALHGARGIGYQKEFEDAAGSMNQSATALISSIRSLNGTAKTLEDIGSARKTPQFTIPQGAKTASGPNGLKLYTTDGGKTWRNAADGTQWQNK